jgi:hypothetical protein
MKMIRLDIKLKDFITFPVADQLDYSFDFCFDVILNQNLATVFWTENYMILALIVAV